MVVVFTLLIRVAHAQIVTVVTEELKPYNYTKNGKLIGVSTEIVEKTLDRAGLEGNIQVFPWLRAYSIATRNPNVLIFSIGRTSKRENLFKWIGPIAPPIRILLFKLKSRKDIKIKTLTDAKQYVIGVPRGAASHDFLKNLGFRDGIHLEPVETVKQNIRKLFLKRVDLFISAEFGIDSHIAEVGHSPYSVEHAFLLREIDLYMAFSRGTSDALYERVKTVFEQIKSEGILETIKTKYEGNQGKKQK